jgi:hypothetical protein
MGNLNESDKKSHAFSFLMSVESAYITQVMAEEVLRRWNDQGKPLFMVPKDFKEKILTNIDGEIKLNYLVSSLLVIYILSLEMADLRSRDRHVRDALSLDHLLAHRTPRQTSQ